MIELERKGLLSLLKTVSVGCSDKAKDPSSRLVLWDKSGTIIKLKSTDGESLTVVRSENASYTGLPDFSLCFDIKRLSALLSDIKSDIVKINMDEDTMYLSSEKCSFSIVSEAPCNFLNTGTGFKEMCRTSQSVLDDGMKFLGGYVKEKSVSVSETYTDIRYGFGVAGGSHNLAYTSFELASLNLKIKFGSLKKITNFLSKSSFESISIRESEKFYLFLFDSNLAYFFMKMSDSIKKIPEFKNLVDQRNSNVEFSLKRSELISCLKSFRHGLDAKSSKVRIRIGQDSVKFMSINSNGERSEMDLTTEIIKSWDIESKDILVSHETLTRVISNNSGENVQFGFTVKDSILVLGDSSRGVILPLF